MFALAVLTSSCEDEVKDEMLNEETPSVASSSYNVVFCTDDPEDSNSLRTSYFFADNVAGWAMKKGKYLKRIYATATKYQPTLVSTTKNGITYCPTGIDLNEGSGGDYVYLWIEYTNDASEAIYDMGSCLIGGPLSCNTNIYPDRSYEYVCDLFSKKPEDLNSNSKTDYKSYLIMYRNTGTVANQPILGLLEMSVDLGTSLPKTITYGGHTYHKVSVDLNYHGHWEAIGALTQYNAFAEQPVYGLGWSNKQICIYVRWN